MGKCQIDIGLVDGLESQIHKEGVPHIHIQMVPHGQD